MPEQNRILCRELSLLAFNRRVLAQAQDTKVPLLERLRFLCIVSSNLDEFFEVRMAWLKRENNCAASAARQTAKPRLKPSKRWRKRRRP